MSKTAVSTEVIQSKIYILRNQKVILDKDLAEMYGVLTKNLNKAVSRNLDRFPSDFMFRLTKEECSRFQFGTLNRGQNIKYLPHVFTEQGVAMLSSVLKSKKAVQVNIQIMRVFTKIREMIASHKDLERKIIALESKFNQHDVRIAELFEEIRGLLYDKEEAKRKKLPFGFTVRKKSYG